jgi:plastocyanin
MAAIGIVAWATLGLGIIACGGDDESGASSTPAGSTPLAKVAKTPSADGSITVVAKNLAFDTDELSSPAGELTIVLDNRDGGTPHNIHFFLGANARGESMGETALTNGPSEETLEMDLAVGDYFFQCDVHPNMNGTLTVS